MKCPYCGCEENWGMQRYRWMERVPWMVNRRCSRCGREFARLAGFIPMRQDTAMTLSKICLFIKLMIWGLAIACIVILLIEQNKGYSFF